MALTKSSVVVVNDVSQAAGAGGWTAVGSDLDLTGAYRAVLRIRITNGATAPTVPHSVKVQVSEDTTGVNYMALVTVDGGTVNSNVAEFTIELPDAAQHARIIYGGNTGQAVTLRVVLDKVTGI